MSENSIAKERNGSLLGEASMLCFSTSTSDSTISKQKKSDGLSSAKRKKLNDSDESESILSEKFIEYDYCEGKNIFSTEVSLNSAARSENDNNDVTIIQHFVLSDLPDISSSPLESHNTDEYVLFNDVVDCEENVIDSSIRSLREASINEKPDMTIHAMRPGDNSKTGTSICGNKNVEETFEVNVSTNLIVHDEKMKNDEQQKVNPSSEVAELLNDDEVVDTVSYNTELTSLKTATRTQCSNISTDNISVGIASAKKRNALERSKIIPGVIPNTAKVSIGNTTISVPLLKNMALLNNAAYVDKTSISNATATQKSRILNHSSQQKINAPKIVSVSQLVNPSTSSNIMQATIISKNLKIDKKAQSIGFPNLPQLTVLQDVSLPKQIFENESDSPKNNIVIPNEKDFINDEQLLQQGQTLNHIILQKDNQDPAMEEQQKKMQETNQKSSEAKILLANKINNETLSLFIPTKDLKYGSVEEIDGANKNDNIKIFSDIGKHITHTFNKNNIEISKHDNNGKNNNNENNSSENIANTVNNSSNDKSCSDNNENINIDCKSIEFNGIRDNNMNISINQIKNDNSETGNYNNKINTTDNNHKKSDKNKNFNNDDNSTNDKDTSNNLDIINIKSIKNKTEEHNNDGVSSALNTDEISTIKNTENNKENAIDKSNKNIDQSSKNDGHSNSNRENNIKENCGYDANNKDSSCNNNKNNNNNESNINKCKNNGINKECKKDDNDNNKTGNKGKNGNIHNISSDGSAKDKNTKEDQLENDNKVNINKNDFVHRENDRNKIVLNNEFVHINKSEEKFVVNVDTSLKSSGYY
ncbi:putative uncharacterized protein DDB_G0282133 [Condylostylus longicornis]|uniref:putative uncharacterized protein DDB_G0282133 n=1 Tax=Condylostylus longicornis TaxID=2530218 RepID=UPI00244E11DE|nr:putative uncharacterized protein DDB_G0282133 [Condylostylus longicornis]